MTFRVYVGAAVATLTLTLPLTAVGQGMGGSPTDRLDWPGAPTDRYLDSDEVRTVLHQTTQAFFECFRTHVRGGAEASDVGINFTVLRDGSASAISPELGQAPQSLGPCLVAVVAAIQFGDHDGDPFEVSYPLVYQVDRRGARVIPYPVVFTRPRPVRLPLLPLPADTTAGEIRMLELILTADEEPPPTPQEPPPASPEPETGELEGGPAPE